MEVDYSRKERIVGVFTISVLVLLLATIITVGRGKDWFKTYITYYTTFAESYNLQSNASVKLFNAEIGKVKKVSLVGNKVTVELDILEDYASRIRQDTIAVVESPTFIGSEYIAIVPGSPTSALVPEGGMIASKEKRSIADLLNEFQVEKTAKMVVMAAQDLSAMADKMSDPQGPLFTMIAKADSIVSHIEGITGDIQDGKGTAGMLLKSRALADRVLASVEKTYGILDDIQRAAAKAPGTMDQVQENLTMVGQVGGEAYASLVSLKHSLQEVEANIHRLKGILSNVETGSNDIPHITRSARQGINEIRAGVENIDKVVQSLQKNILIRSNLPPVPAGTNTDAGLRP